MREESPMRWQRGVTLAALLLAWALLAGWQWQAYREECKLCREEMVRHADSITSALVGGAQSHRRPGRFLEDAFQRILEDAFQRMLDVLVKPQEYILAVGVVSSDRQISSTAGNSKLLKLDAPIEPGQYWDPNGFRYVVAFQIDTAFGPGPGGPGPGAGPGNPLNFNQGRPTPDADMPERRQNRGEMRRFTGQPTSGSRSQRVEAEKKDAATSKESKPKEIARDRNSEPSRDEPLEGRLSDMRGREDQGPNNWPGGPPDEPPTAQSGRFFAVLVLDRTRYDQQISRFFWMSISVVIAGGLVIASLAFVWRATVRLAEARGHAQLLENEAGHLRDLSQAAAGLAHETRSPLGLIRGWTQRWVQGMPEGHQNRQQAQAVIEECDRVTARINQFLAFARPCEPKNKSLRPAELFGELVALLEPDLDAKRLTLLPTVAPPGLTVQADREMLRQALFNLIQNAVEFSPDGAAIEIAAKTGQGGRVRIEVADRGPGVPAEEVNLLFTPYHTTRANGTGLGLAIVRRIASAHGWEAGYLARPGGGSIFWLDGIHV
jgi:signal transduction histidine kinase